MKRLFIAVIGLIILASFAFVSSATAARNSQDYLGKGLWWDGENLLISAHDADTTELDTSNCSEIRYESGSLGTVAVNSLYSELFSSCLRDSADANLPDNSTLDVGDRSYDNDAYPSLPDGATYRITISNAPPHPDTVEYYCTENDPRLDTDVTPEEWVISVASCWRLELPEPKSWQLEYTGIRKQNGAMIFRSKTNEGGAYQIDGCSVKVLAQVAQNADGSYSLTQDLETDWFGWTNDWCRSNDAKLDTLFGADVKAERDIRGTPGVSAQQSGTEMALADQKVTLKNAYIQAQCDANSLAGPSQMCNPRASDSFEIIWRICAQTSGNQKADIGAANNCLKKYAGKGIDIEMAEASVPPKPSSVPIEGCRVEVLGYVICPMMRFMANAADAMFSTMQKLLHVSPLDRSEAGGAGAYKAWSVLRDVANVIFVISLLAAIISQLTGYGITNYGLKKFMPKLVVAAILVNISFLICVILVDISNIAGDSIHEVLIALNSSLPSDGSAITANMGSASNGIKWAALIGAGLVGGGIVLAIVMMFVPILTAVLLALMTVVLLLLTRQAMIIILTVVAPIAFVLYLLPNTKKWFSKWRSYFITLLMLYPLIAVIFGLSTIAANVVLQIGTAADSTTLELFALAIQAIPLVITPIVVKLGGQALGDATKAIRNNGLTKGIRSRSGGLQERIVKRRKLRALKGGRGPIAALYRRQVEKDAIRSARKNELSRAESSYMSRYMQGAEGSGGDKSSLGQRAVGVALGRNPNTKADRYVKSIAAGGADGAHDRTLAAALSIASNIETDEAKTAKAAMEHVTENDLAAILAQARDGTSTLAQSTVQAAAELATEKGDGDGNAIAGALAASDKLTPDGREALLKTSQKTTVGALTSNPTTAQAIRSGSVVPQNYEQTVLAPSFNEGTISAAGFGSLDETTMRQVLQAQTNGQLTNQGSETLTAVAQEARDNDKIQLEEGQKQVISEILGEHSANTSEPRGSR